jgi:hypothetical protein
MTLLAREPEVFEVIMIMTEQTKQVTQLSLSLSPTLDLIRERVEPFESTRSSTIDDCTAIRVFGLDRLEPVLGAQIYAVIIESIE